MLHHSLGARCKLQQFSPPALCCTQQCWEWGLVGRADARARGCGIRGSGRELAQMASADLASVFLASPNCELRDSQEPSRPRIGHSTLWAAAGRAGSRRQAGLGPPSFVLDSAGSASRYGRQRAATAAAEHHHEGAHLQVPRADRCCSLERRRCLSNGSLPPPPAAACASLPSATLC